MKQAEANFTVFSDKHENFEDALKKSPIWIKYTVLLL
jgi:hypothetical protein